MINSLNIYSVVILSDSIKTGLRRFFIRSFLMFLLIMLYFYMDWSWFQLTLCDIIINIFRFVSDYHITNGNGNIYHIIMNGTVFYISANCTYMDLVLTILPFCFSFHRALPGNICRILFISTGICFFNIIRIMISMHLYEKGFAWQTAHNLPDIFIHILTIIIFVLISLKDDFRQNEVMQRV